MRNNHKEKTMNVHDIVANGWKSGEITQAVLRDPEMRPNVARVIDATRKLLSVPARELSDALSEQERAIDALKNYIASKQITGEHSFSV